MNISVVKKSPETAQAACRGIAFYAPTSYALTRISQPIFFLFYHQALADGGILPGLDPD